jgi:hypothetical protein
VEAGLIRIVPRGPVVVHVRARKATIDLAEAPARALQ